MPQMSPMPWIFILLLTLATILYFSSLMYFNFKLHTTTNKS
uniref:ATP synthase complex subunit 8 n=1 Tax=Lanthanaphalara mira TaxID=2218050 RepID=A0A344A2G0_9HEMI|nr:ATP synthase F0 subunit 8 [Lanthanaphalara mira]AWU48951.1 ATP synthase F0 subunit 8 [Lanthanaphalara mira]